MHSLHDDDERLRWHVARMSTLRALQCLLRHRLLKRYIDLRLLDAVTVGDLLDTVISTIYKAIAYRTHRQRAQRLILPIIVSFSCASRLVPWSETQAGREHSITAHVQRSGGVCRTHMRPHCTRGLCLRLLCFHT
jgi:hypothetical protein